MMGSIESFWAEVDNIYGTYLDANTAFFFYKLRIEEGQQQAAAMVKASIEQLDKARWSYGKGNPNDPDAVQLHGVTQGELKERLSKGGRNEIHQARMALVSIYQLWEDRYRAEVAVELGLEKNALGSDVLGDLRQIRIAIVHHGGVAKADIDKCKTLKWFKAGDAINVQPDQMYDLICRLQGQCREWVEARSGLESNAVASSKV
jgi:hypothetical protein